MEGVRCRTGSRAWLDVWESMAPACRDAVTLIRFDHLLNTLDNYLRKHRFCQECKNKVIILDYETDFPLFAVIIFF